MREKDREILRELISSVSKIKENKLDEIIKNCDEKYFNLGSLIKDKKYRLFTYKNSKNI